MLPQENSVPCPEREGKRKGGKEERKKEGKREGEEGRREENAA